MTQSSDAEFAQLLSRSFLSAVRGAEVHKIISNGSYDASKIFFALAKGGVAFHPFEITSVDGALNGEPITVKGGHNVFPSPADCKHYVFSNNNFQAPDIVAYRLHNVYFSFDIRNRGNPRLYVFDCNKRLIDGLLFGADPFIDDAAECITEPSVLIEDFFVKYNICHFLYDKYPRWYIANQNFGLRQAITFFDGSYYSGLFSRLLAPHLALCDKVRRGTVFFRDVVIFSNSFAGLRHPAQYGAEAHLTAIQTLRASVRAETPDAARRRFMVLRPTDLPRAIKNQDDVIALLNKFGFESGDPGLLTADEQFALFAQTSVLIGVHGAGLTNFVFQAKNSVLIELLPPLYASNAYWFMASAMGMQYRPLICVDPDLENVNSSRAPRNPSENIRRDVIVPLDGLESVLSSLQ